MLLPIVPKKLEKAIARKILIASIALILGVLVIEVQSFRRWTIEASSFIAPTITVLEFLIPKYKELD